MFDMNGSLVEDEMSEFISKPSGLKIKLNLKKIRDYHSCSRESSAEPQINKDEDDSVSDLREMSPLDESDSTQSENTINELETTVTKTDTSKQRRGVLCSHQDRKNKSSHLENLEVYHTTDELNRRSCPFWYFGNLCLFIWVKVKTMDFGNYCRLRPETCQIQTTNEFNKGMQVFKFKVISL